MCLLVILRCHSSLAHVVFYRNRRHATSIVNACNASQSESLGPNMNCKLQHHLGFLIKCDHMGLNPKIGGCYPQNGWWKSWKTLCTNGWFGGKHPYFWKHPCFTNQWTKYASVFTEFWWQSCTTSCIPNSGTFTVINHQQYEYEYQCWKQENRRESRHLWVTINNPPCSE